MGLTRRPYPRRLSEKLLQIRERLDLSQNGMLRKLGLQEDYDRATISGYERGEREPPLPILLKYAEVANVCLDVLADDERDLPSKIPAKRPTIHKDK
jgi:transcriptional regulator with XRE-family HTH domain